MIDWQLLALWRLLCYYVNFCCPISNNNEPELEMKKLATLKDCARDHCDRLQIWNDFNNTFINPNASGANTMAGQ